MTRLEQAHLFLEFYFSPWGAAKGEVWEAISCDRPFTDSSATFILNGILTGERLLSKNDIKLMEICVR